MARSKVKSRSHHNIAHLHPPTNVTTKYQLPTLYGFWNTAWKTFSRHPPANPLAHPDTMGENNTKTTLKVSKLFDKAFECICWNLVENEPQL